MTVEQCLYGLLLKSANEVANGLVEKVSGSVSGFAGLMNQKAAALGCTGTHFVNPNGLNDSNHYTTPYYMALIARAAFQNDTLRKIDTTLSYKFPATKNAGERTITMGHKMMYSTDSRYYPGIIGGKTGYTSKAGNTLVTGAEKNGVRLIAVVMKSKSSGEWLQFSDATYRIDSNGYMATGWRKYNNGAWYYFKSSGVMAKNTWIEDNSKWFYLGGEGYMLKDTIIDGRYRLNAEGVWIQ